MIRGHEWPNELRYDQPLSASAMTFKRPVDPRGPLPANWFINRPARPDRTTSACVRPMANGSAAPRYELPSCWSWTTPSRAFLADDLVHSHGGVQMSFTSIRRFTCYYL
jgi:hypothetical protein